VGDVEQILEKRETELEVLKATIGEKAVEIEAKDKIILSSKVRTKKRMDPCDWRLIFSKPLLDKMA
jgi:hypothetical protein